MCEDIGLRGSINTRRKKGRSQAPISDEKTEKIMATGENALKLWFSERNTSRKKGEKGQWEKMVSSIREAGSTFECKGVGIRIEEKGGEREMRR